MIRSALAVMLVLAGISLGGPVKFQGPSGPARDSIINGKVHKQIKVTATDVDPKAGIVWRYDEAKLDVRFCDKSRREAWITGPPGTYRIEVMTVKLGADGATEVDQAFVTLAIAKDVDDPVKPVDPVDPVKPVDPVVPSSDPLVKAFADAYHQDAETDKAALKSSFAKAFRAAREDVVLDKARTTAGLFDAIGVLLDADKVKGKIIHTQEAVNAYLKEQVPGIELPITPSRKAKIKNEFAKIADALDAVK